MKNLICLAIFVIVVSFGLSEVSAQEMVETNNPRYESEKPKVVEGNFSVIMFPKAAQILDKTGVRLIFKKVR